MRWDSEMDPGNGRRKRSLGRLICLTRFSAATLTLAECRCCSASRCPWFLGFSSTVTARSLDFHKKRAAAPPRPAPQPLLAGCRAGPSLPLVRDPPAPTAKIDGVTTVNRLSSSSAYETLSTRPPRVSPSRHHSQHRSYPLSPYQTQVLFSRYEEDLFGTLTFGTLTLRG